MRVPAPVPDAALVIQLPAKAPVEAVEDSSSPWAPRSLVGDLKDAAGSQS